MCGRTGSPHRLALPQPVPNSPSPAPRVPIQRPHMIRKSRVYLEAAKDEKLAKRICSQEKTRVPQPLIMIPDPRDKRQKEKVRSSFYYIYIQQNFTGNNPYCTGQGPGWVRNSPRWRGREGLKRYQFVPKTACNSSSSRCPAFKELQTMVLHFPPFLTL